MTTSTTNSAPILPEQAAAANGNGRHPRPDLHVWGYPAGVESLPDLLAVLESMSISWECLGLDAEELLEQAGTAVAFAEQRIRINLARERGRERRRDRSK